MTSGMPPPFVLKPPSNPSRVITDEYEGKWIATGIKPPKPGATLYQGVVEYYTAKMKKGRDFFSEPYGLYTWIIKSGVIVSMPVLSAQEVGSVHVNMWSWTPELGRLPSAVSAAGELRKVGTNIEFNLKSGTFMKSKLAQNSVKKVDDIAEYVIAEFAKIGISATFLKCNPCTSDYDSKSGLPIIDSATIITNSGEMFFLKELFVLKHVAEPNAVSYPEMNKALGGEGGARRVRKQRTRCSRCRRRLVATPYKNLTRRRRTKRQVRQKNDFYNVSADFRYFR
jgi:hypothetical protein